MACGVQLDCNFAHVAHRERDAYLIGARLMQCRAGRKALCNNNRPHIDTDKQTSACHRRALVKQFLTGGVYGLHVLQIAVRVIYRHYKVFTLKPRSVAFNLLSGNIRMLRAFIIGRALAPAVKRSCSGFLALARGLRFPFRHCRIVFCAAFICHPYILPTGQPCQGRCCIYPVIKRDKIDNIAMRAASETISRQNIPI